MVLIRLDVYVHTDPKTMKSEMVEMRVPCGGTREESELL